MKARSLAAAALFAASCAPAAGPATVIDLPTVSAPTQETTKGNADVVALETPVADAVVTSPLRVRGRARGTWYFEASFPVKLLDDAGRVLAQVPARAQGEWMTESYVPFEAELTFETHGAQRGALVLEKDNASGLPEHADELRVPVRFAAP